MIITVQISDFRNNLAAYLARVAEGDEISLKRGKQYEAKIICHPQNIKKVNMAKNVLKNISKLRKQLRLKTEAKDAGDLVNEIDRVVYGIDRNGREPSS